MATEILAGSKPTTAPLRRMILQSGYADRSAALESATLPPITEFVAALSCAVCMILSPVLLR